MPDLTPETVTARDFRTQLADHVGRVRHGGARLLLTHHGHPVAGVVPVADLQRLAQLGAPEPPPCPVVEISVLVPAEPTAVWRAWFETRTRIRWWPSVTLDPWVGGEIYENYDLGGRITAVSEPEWCTFGWNERDRAPTEVRVNLDAVNTDAVNLDAVNLDAVSAGAATTHVTLTQTGWAADDEQRAEHHRRRWAGLLDALARRFSRR